jgi:protein-S-isoprenylcysteine O-methyltransferase
MHRFLPAFAAAPAWQALFWTAYLAWLGMELWILSRDRRAASGEAGDRGSLRFLVVMFGIGLWGAFTIAYRLAWGRISAPPALLVPLAVAVMLGGMAFRAWAVVTLGRFFRTSVMVLDDHRLVDSGPYRRLRNPSYTGGVVTLAGIGLALGSWPGLAWLLFWTLLGYARRIAVEDAALRRRFGADYEAFRKGRWALIPPIW